MNPTSRVVVDLGNSRLKWAALSAEGMIEGLQAVAPGDPDAIGRVVNEGGDRPGDSWAVSSVNPPVAERLRAALERRGVADVRLFRSARDVSLSHRLENAETAGADRALAVLAATRLHPGGGPGLVVSCGTAVTVERIGEDQIWQGGAIAPGLGPLARSLHELTAQLPRLALEPLNEPDEPPPAWGASTVPALRSGLYWGLVGSIREILTRQAEGFRRVPWLFWTGGDADWLAKRVAWPGARVVPDLVLRGLAAAAFGVDPIEAGP